MRPGLERENLSGPVFLDRRQEPAVFYEFRKQRFFRNDLTYK